LIVSESPWCRTNVTLPGNAIDEFDFLEITCNVTHSGSWTPAFSCAPGLPGLSSNQTSSSLVLYRRVIAASDITDSTMLHCTMKDFYFTWNTSTIRVVNSVGKQFTLDQKLFFNFVLHAIV